LSSNTDQGWRAERDGGPFSRLRETLGHVAERFIAPSAPGLWGFLSQIWNRIRTPELALVGILCDSQKTSVEAGRNTGAFAFQINRSSASCIVFESDPASFALLRKSAPRGMLVEHGVASNLNGRAAIPIGKSAHSVGTSLPARRLDDCAFGEIGFIQIDDVDREDEILDGAERILARDRPTLLITMEDRKKSHGIASTVERLTRHGYAGFFLADGKILGISQFYADIDQPSSYRLRRKRYVNRFAFVHTDDPKRIAAFSTGDLAGARRIMDDRPRREFTVAELVGQVYANRRLVMGWVLAGFFCALVYDLRSPRLYSATMTIGHNIHDTGQTANLSGASQLVRNLTGGGDTDGKYQRFLMTLTSNRTARRLDQKIDLLHTLNKDAWDPVNKIWKRPHGLRFEMRQKLNSILGLPTWKPPSVEDLSGYLSRVLTSTQSPTTAGVYRLEVLDRDPQMARTILQDTFAETNEQFREEDRRSAEQSVAYVLKKLSTTTALEDRQALTASLTEAERQLVMINIEPNYVAEPLTDIAVSNGPVRPFVMLALLLGPLMGFFIGVIMALFRRQRP